MLKVKRSFFRSSGNKGYTQQVRLQDGRVRKKVCVRKIGGGGGRGGDEGEEGGKISAYILCE